MDSRKVVEVIKLYKQHFKSIHNDEIYKWHAVKCFQDNWDIDSVNFLTMLESSFALAKNLLDSGLYFPKQMLLLYTAKDPETVRQLFVALYNEDNDLIERIVDFRDSIRVLHNKYFKDKNNYQDERAVLVYLCLRYPDRYYLYKFTMFKVFAEIVNYPYQPKKGDIQNILEYLSLCDIVRSQIIKDTELLYLHNTRIKEQEYLDSSYNILTQDIIYAAVQHINEFDKGGVQEPALNRLKKVDKLISPRSDEVVLKGSFTNYIENEKENKRIGDLGELLVLQHEQEKLKSHGINKPPKHISKSDGDGLGYDILSFDENGNEIYIEVKTTRNGVNTPFYITRNELERSKLDHKKFFLYRLYDFDDINNSAKYFKRSGDLTELCNNPIVYKAAIVE